MLDEAMRKTFAELEKKRHLDPLSLWPVTIICDRYQGTYSNGRYTAFNMDWDDVPSDIAAGDISCMEFWAEWRAMDPEKRDLIGIGATPDEALKDLHAQFLERNPNP